MVICTTHSGIPVSPGQKKLCLMFRHKNGFEVLVYFKYLEMYFSNVILQYDECLQVPEY